MLNQHILISESDRRKSSIEPQRQSLRLSNVHTGITALTGDAPSNTSASSHHQYYQMKSTSQKDDDIMKLDRL